MGYNKRINLLTLQSLYVEVISPNFIGVQDELPEVGVAVLERARNELGARRLEEAVPQVEHLQPVDSAQRAGHGARTFLREGVVVHVQYPGKIRR